MWIRDSEREWKAGFALFVSAFRRLSKRERETDCVVLISFDLKSVFLSYLYSRLVVASPVQKRDCCWCCYSFCCCRCWCWCFYCWCQKKRCCQYCFQTRGLRLWSYFCWIKLWMFIYVQSHFWSNVCLRFVWKTAVFEIVFSKMD